jgi:PAS domain S-box-containing protein
MKLETQLLQDVCDQISAEIEAIVTIFGSRGQIIASSKRSRIGTFHEGAAKVMNGDLDSFTVTAEEAAKSSTMLEGCTSAIDFEGQRLLSVAVAAPLDIARRYMRIVRYWILSHLVAIEARSTYEASMKASEERFRDVAETAGDWIWEMDENLRFTYLSPRFFQIFPVLPAMIIGKTRQEFAGRELDEPHWLAHYSDLAERRPFRDFAYSTMTMDGTVRYIQISGKPILNENGEYTGYRGTGRDVTSLILHEREATEARQRLMEAIATISEGFALYDDRDRLLLCNKQYKELIGDGTGTTVQIGDTFETILRRALDNGLIAAPSGDTEAWIGETVAKHRDPGEPIIRQRGDGRWSRISEKKTRDGGVVALFSDLTEIKRHEVELEESHQRFRDVAEVAGDWIWEMDSELRFKFLSERFFQIFTLPREAIIGKTRHEFAGRAMEAAHWQAHYRDLNARKPFRSFEYDVTLPNEKLAFIQISGKPVFGQDGTFKGYRGTGTDITELRLREQQLATERERLRRVLLEVSEKNSMLESLSGKLSRYLPPQVYATIFSGAQDVKVVSERKKLTVFFSDIVGFTETTDKMESEDLTHLLNEYLTEMSRIARDHGATIDKYIGDAIMIFFGDPESRGVAQDAIACVKMAVAMQKRIRELAVMWRDVGIERPLTCRIGIHTGYCTVGNFGSEDRVSYTAVGGGVNLASRLESEAPPGEILISYETNAHVKDEVICEEVGKISVKGIAHPVTTYRVIEDFEGASESEVVRARLPHLTLNLDPRRMTAEEQDKARHVLESALDRLGAQPAGKANRIEARS